MTANTHSKSAYGGQNWSPRVASHLEEIGSIWTSSGINSEWKRLKQVLLHPPGPELSAAADPEAVQMLALPDYTLAREQHNMLAQALLDAGVQVHFVNPETAPSPNLIFCADLFFMTPQGAILARPASTVRAGEERQVARRLADIGIPILRTLTGTATFEGADAHWLDPHTVLIGQGLRTNIQAFEQISITLAEIGVATIAIDLPLGTMHLMGILRFLDQDLVLTWPYRIAWRAVDALREQGFKVLTIPDENEAVNHGAVNFITLGPRHILMADNSPQTQTLLESHGVICQTITVNELLKAAGGIGCLTGIIEREM